jgi:O-antigen/teichoic acid export membrane protein
MTISVRFLLKGTIWTVGATMLGQAFRLATNIILARLLAPQLFGIMLLVNSFRSGIELISDIGIGANVIYHKDANNPEFYNTAWTLQVIRSVGLWLVALVLAIPFARFYQSPILLFVVPLTAFGIVLSGFSSVSIALLLKRFQISKHNVFDILMLFLSSATFLVFAYFSPTIWALVFGGLFGSTVAMIGTYFLLPDIKQRFYLSKHFAGEILHYGKWIFASSIVYFLSTNFDRLYFAKVIPINLLGVYGIARSMSELVGLLILRFGNFVLFPLIASHSHIPRADLRQQIFSIRLIFLMLTGVGFSLIAATADLLFKMLYDERYQAAVWMLPLLIIGSWFSILAYVNESTLLGLGKPSYSAISNGSKFIFLLIGLPISVSTFGLFGGILVVVFSDLFRYFPFLIGQKREHFSFGVQDLIVTLTVFLLIGLWEWLRWASGFGTSFDSLPIEVGVFFAPFGKN